MDTRRDASVFGVMQRRRLVLPTRTTRCNLAIGSQSRHTSAPPRHRRGDVIVIGQYDDLVSAGGEVRNRGGHRIDDASVIERRLSVGSTAIVRGGICDDAGQFDHQRDDVSKPAKHRCGGHPNGDRRQCSVGGGQTVFGDAVDTNVTGHISCGRRRPVPIDLT